MLFYFHPVLNCDHFSIEMKVRAAILLFCFCGLFNGTESFADFVESLFSSQASNKYRVENSGKETHHPSTNTGSNEESCCCSNAAVSAYVVQNGLNYTQSVNPSFKPIAYVVNHYRTSYRSSIWRPPVVA